MVKVIEKISKYSSLQNTKETRCGNCNTLLTFHAACQNVCHVCRMKVPPVWAMMLDSGQRIGYHIGYFSDDKNN